MNMGTREVALLWGLNFLVSCGYLLVCMLWVLPRKPTDERSRGEYWLRAVFMVLCPVAGPLYLAGSFLLEHTLLYREIDLSDVVFRKEKARTYATVDEERERDLAPIEETLEIGDRKNLRTLMLNVLRGNLEDSLGSIALALNSKDSETSHYAASVLRDELNDFRVRVQQLREEIRTEPEEEWNLETMLLDYMSRILEQKVFSDLEQKKYVRILDETAEQLYRKQPAALTPARYETLCSTARDCALPDLAEKWTERLAGQYPEELAAYTSRLKLAFQQNDRERFFAVLDALKRSDVVIDQETLELIRMFESSKGETNTCRCKH